MRCKAHKMKKDVFCIFAALQGITLGLIIFFLLSSSNMGADTRIVLSVLFPVFTVAIEYMAYAR
ncbi:hypothetical protein KY358_06570 [Candidatus Woesearchaeota archaeon]|nr:hypothetical protein [Candidatus Woesearchaeota archaeon]